MNDLLMILHNNFDILYIAIHAINVGDMNCKKKKFSTLCSSQTLAADIEERKLNNVIISI